jgi:hypothetical protein
VDNETKPSSLTLSSEVTKLSETISKPIERLFQVGGLALVFVFIGFLSMLFGYFNKAELSGWVFWYRCLDRVCLFVSISVQSIVWSYQGRPTTEGQQGAN